MIKNNPLLVNQESNLIKDEDFVPDLRKSNFFSSLISYLMILIILPLYLVVIIIIISVTIFFTVTMIGPLIHKLYSVNEDKLLQKLLIEHPEMGFLEIPAGINASSGSNSYKISTRITKPKFINNNLPVVIFPGGLAATLLCMHRTQDRLTEEGFICVQYDRIGVGYSDINPTGISPSAFDCANEMNYVMKYCDIPKDSTFISLGASMGSIVTEAFMAIYPNKLVGFINIDGVPHSFIKSNKQYVKQFAPLYKGMSNIAWTGLMRSLFSNMKTKLDKSFASKSIPVNSILAQMHRSRFFSNAYLEFFTMMSCCDLVCTSYGKISPTKMDNDLFYRVITSAPSRSTIVDECNNIEAINTNERSASELGKDWSSSDVTKEILKNYTKDSSDFGDLKLTNADNNEHPISSTGLVGGITKNTTIYPIGIQLSKMFVRVFSARSYDMGDDAFFGEWAYPQINRNRSAAEHNIHSLLAKDGARIIFPKLTHASLFAQTEQIVIIFKEFKEYWKNNLV